jgi:hypothetical protein
VVRGEAAHRRYGASNALPQLLPQSVLSHLVISGFPVDHRLLFKVVMIPVYHPVIQDLAIARRRN